MPLSTQDIQDLIVNDATLLGNDPALMLALADHESAGFNPNALSPTGVRGLFQVTNQTGGPYGQTPQTRSDPTVSSDVGQRHFKDLLHKAGGNVETALRWYNGGSDPQFAQRVLAKVPGHQARLGKTASTDAILNDVYGPATPPTPSASPGAAPSTDAIVQELYGPTPGTSGTPLPMMAPDTPLPPSQLTLDIAKPSAGNAPEAADGPFSRYTGKPDLPIQETQSPIDMILDAYTMGKGTSIAREGYKWLAPKAGRLSQRVVEGLALEGTHKVQQAVGNTPGSITDFGWLDVANLALPAALDPHGLGREAMGYTRAGRAVQTATKATAAEEATYASRLAEAEAAQARQVAADRTRLMPDGSVPPVTPVPQTLQSLRSTPPTPVAPAPIHMPSWGHMLSELGLGSLVTPFVGTGTGAKIAGGLYLADSAEALVSKALMSPTLRPWFLRQLEANGGTLNPQILGTLSAVMGGAMPGAQPEAR